MDDINKLETLGMGPSDMDYAAFVRAFEAERLPIRHNRASNILGASIALLAGLDGADLGRFLKFRPDTQKCIECGNKIPPGRAGRKCGPCRGITS